MKKMMTLAVMMTIAISAAAMNYNTARNEALFLTDKMAYELGLTNNQLEAVYEINLDYLLKVDNYNDVAGIWWEVRNRDLRYVLSTWQYDCYISSAYFYRPVAWNTGTWSFSIYSRYGRSTMYTHRPDVYISYRGGHSSKGTSYYAGRGIDKPKTPVSHSSPTGNDARPSTGNGNGNNHGTWSHSNNGNKEPSTGTGSHSSSTGTGFGTSHSSSSATAPSRTFNHNTAGTASSGSNAPKGQFGSSHR